MALISINKNEEVKKITFEVAYQENFDLAIVTQLLAKLGLKTAGLVKAFSDQIYKGNFTLHCLSEIRKDKKLLSNYLRIARTAKTVLINVDVSVSILNQIALFLTSNIAKEIGNRLKDAGSQEISGIYNSIRGAGLNIAEANKDKLTGAGKTLSGAWDGLTSSVGSPKFNQGWNQAGEGLSQIGKGYAKEIIQTPADFLLTRLTKTAGGLQTLLGLESIGRLLEQGEKTLLQSIFGLSVEYDAIRIKTGYAGILSAGDDGGFTLTNNNRAITIGNTIYMKNKIKNLNPQSDWLSTLVHETVHVWQHQNGGTDYMLEALHAQFTGGYGYDYDALVNKKSWAMLSPEQQGKLIEDAYSTGFLQNGVPSGKWMEIQPKGGGIVQRTDFEQYFLSQNILVKLRNGQGAT